MSEPETGSRSGTFAREWPYLFCALCVAAVVIAGLAAGTAPGPAPPEAPTRAKDGAAELERLVLKPKPLAAAVLEGLTLAAIVWSAGFLLSAAHRRTDVFPEARLARARWTEWDVAKLLFVFLFVRIAVEPFALSGRPESALVVHGIAELLTALVALHVIRSRGQDPADALGLRLRGLAPHLLPGLVVFLASVPILLGLTVGWTFLLERLPGGEFSIQQHLVKELARTPSTAQVAQMAVAAVLIAPVVEELFFRGLLYGVLRRRVTPAIAIPCVGVLFGLFHLPALGAVLPLAVLGALLCYVYEKTGRLTVPIVIHVLFNFYTVFSLVSRRLA